MLEYNDQEDLMASFRPDLVNKQFKQEPPIETHQFSHHSRAPSYVQDAPNQFVQLPNLQIHNNGLMGVQRQPYQGPMQVIQQSHQQQFSRPNAIMQGQIRHIVPRRNSPPVTFHYNLTEQVRQQRQQHFQLIQAQQMIHPPIHQQVFVQPQIIQHEIHEQMESIQVTETIMIWQQRFYGLYEKYGFFFERYESFVKEITFLTEQFTNVDSEEEWIALKEKYEAMVDKMSEVREEYAQFLMEAREIIEGEQRFDSSNSIKEEDGKVWEHRYHELLEQYQSLTHHYAELQNNSMAHGDSDENERVAVMNEKYARLQAEYNHVVTQLQDNELPDGFVEKEKHEELLKYVNQLQSYIEQLEGENNNMMKNLKNSVDGSKMLDQGQFKEKLQDKDQEIKHLTYLIVGFEEKIKKLEQKSVKNSRNVDMQNSQMANQLNQLEIYSKELQAKLSLKQYEINGLKDKNSYLEEELHQKNQTLIEQTKNLNLKMSRIEKEISSKNAVAINQAPSHFNINADYEQKIEQQAKNLQIKHHQIQTLEERIYTFESQLRKVNYQRQSINRSWEQKIKDFQVASKKQINEKDFKIRQLQSNFEESEEQHRKKYRQNDVLMKSIRLELDKTREEADLKVIEKELIIKSLRDALQRFENELKDRNVEISRIRSPFRSPNQSYVNQNQRFDDELKLLTEQVERKSEENNKLKKERELRNNQYSDLQNEFRILQEENNRRRIQINALKRNLSQSENLSYEIENLKLIITKKNQEISELKEILFEKDRVKLESDAKSREIERLNEVNKAKSKEFHAQNQRVFELEQKIRELELKHTSIYSQQSYSQVANNYNEIQALQDSLRKKDTEINKLKASLDQHEHDKQELANQIKQIRIKNASTLKTFEIELLQTKNRINLLEKRKTDSDQIIKELEVQNRRNMEVHQNQLNSQEKRIKGYYESLISKLEQQTLNLKQKIKKYEESVDGYELQFQNFKNRMRENEILKNELNRKIKSLSEKVEEKQEEVKTLKNRENTEISSFRKKESRFIELETQLKAKDYQLREGKSKLEESKLLYKNVKKEYEDYRASVFDKLSDNNQKQMENLSQKIIDYESRILNPKNLDFKVKDKKANQVFERKVIYDLKKENDLLREELEGRGINISLERLKIKQIQQENLIKSKHIINRSDNELSSELLFYKEKNRQLEERVNNHIQVNRDLNERISNILTENQESNSFQAHHQIQHLQTKLQETQQKVSLLTEENKNLKRQINNSLSKDHLIQDHEVKNQDLYNQISQLNQDRNSSLNSHAHAISLLNEKCLAYEKQIAKILSQNKLLSSERERLNEVLSNRNNSNKQVQFYQGKIQELSRIIELKESQLQQFEEKYTSLYKTCQEYEVQIKNYEKTVTASSNGQGQIQNLKNEINNLSNYIREVEGENERLNQYIYETAQQSEVQRASDARGVNSDVKYHLELLRNNLIEQSCLAQEIPQNEDKLRLLGNRLLENSERGLISIQSINSHI